MSELKFEDGEDFAMQLDANEEMKNFRERFCYPTVGDIKRQMNVDSNQVDDTTQAVYLCGNSLGLMPRKTVEYVNRELNKWGCMGVLGHEHGQMPWLFCEDFPADILPSLMGCQRDEVVVMNNLTTNIHLLLSSFYRPTSSRFKLAIEGDAFPSDHYAMENHAELHGFNKDEALVVFRPREGENLIRDDDIVQRIEKESESLAVIFMSAVHFRTGQFFDIARIAEAGRKVGAIVGIDLAHSIGNVPLKLNEWGVDFACACTYKYLNAGAGSIGIGFISRRHFDRKPRLIGWFAHRLDTRFAMNNILELEHGASGFKTGNQSPLLCASLQASLELFREAGGIEKLRKKSLQLTGYLEWLLNKSDIFTNFKNRPVIVTPGDTRRRGCQLSIRVNDPPGAEKLGKELQKRSVICDIRKPDIIRVAPAPLYNSFEDAWKFVIALRNILQELQK